MRVLSRTLRPCAPLTDRRHGSEEVFDFSREEMVSQKALTLKQRLNSEFGQIYEVGPRAGGVALLRDGAHTGPPPPPAL